MFTPAPPEPETNTLATLSVVFALVFAPVGAVLGHMGLSQIHRTGQRGRDRALIGLTLSYTVIVIAVVAVVVSTVTGPADAGQRPPGAPSSTNASPTPATRPSTTTTTSVMSAPPSSDAISAVINEPSCGVLEGIDRERAKATLDLPAATMYAASEWSPEQRDIMTGAAQAFRTAADRLVPSIEQTPNRFVRELYEQYVAYSRAFADAVPNYVAAQSGFAYAAIFINQVVLGICAVVERGKPDVYLAQIPPIDIGQPPPPPPPDPANPPVMLTQVMPNCDQWRSAMPVSLSTELMTDRSKGDQYAEVLLGLGAGGANPLAYDIAAFTAYYLRVAAVVTDTNVQQGYRNVGTAVWDFINSACKAAGA